ncbi:heterokaryon incompatibility protein-domain-containing protein [Lophiotrema nucula]|uniref:Heterokaryon incompatibility protein-domain-containing protein n=1 Tax=Lophiotrema nucula TaxID=690887 RepID=A0A6A5YPU7_9PLEO|nr:heterokaryon incompatibility protein-domain-containing protein [Lophiotrema nucula]
MSPQSRRCVHPSILRFKSGPYYCPECSKYKSVAKRTDLIPDEYEYQPLSLDTGEETRLILLYPGEAADPVECEIIHVDLSQATDHDYEALSYTWGDENGETDYKRVIYCSNLSRSLEVTDNCWLALRRLRDRNTFRTLWVDAICIDQFNLAERNHQVSFMRTIYSRASRVIVYLGERHWPTNDYEDLFSRRWFSRVWVIQELALAQEAQMLVGDYEHYLNDFYLEKIRDRCYNMNIRVPGPFQWSPGERSTDNLLLALHAARSCSSTEPKDKFYGLLGLADGSLRSAILVDYRRSLEETFTHAAATLIAHEQQLSVLAFAFSSPRHADQSLPTWVPDWTDQVAHEPIPYLLLDDEVGPWRFRIQIKIRSCADVSSSEVSDIVCPWLDGCLSPPHLRVRAHCLGHVNIQLSILYEWQTGYHVGSNHNDHFLSVKDFETWKSYQYGLLDPFLRRGPLPMLARSRLNDVEFRKFLHFLISQGSDKYLFRVGLLPAIARRGFAEADNLRHYSRSFDPNMVAQLARCALEYAATTSRSPPSTFVSSAINNPDPAWLGWVAKPNLPHGRASHGPKRGEKWYYVSFRKVQLMTFTVIAPEMLIGSAVGEFWLARASVDRKITPGWTTTHGIFALMGGFVVESGHHSPGIYRINDEGILSLKNDGMHRLVIVTGDNINDRSKADILVKATACLKGLWLVVQYGARAHQNLPFTPLELATIGFVGCSLITYTAWFSKPQQANETITVLRCPLNGHPLGVQSKVKEGWMKASNWPINDSFQ